MKTGERRSLVIAVAAIIFALFGFDVRCAHLEEYISAQDFYKYNELFSFLQVENSIIYNNIFILNNYAADGLFAEACFKNSKSYIYLNKELSIYNILR